MKALLDTHALLWFVADHPSLSKEAKVVMGNHETELILSVGSCWELALKHSLGKLELAKPFEAFRPAEIEKNAIGLLPITLGHLTKLVTLPLHHRDPFDRLLAAQALSKGLPLVSGDAAFDAYGVQRIW